MPPEPSPDVADERPRSLDPEDMPEDEKPELLKKLEERKERHQERGIVARIGVVIIGVFLVMAGVVMSGPGVPGPGILVILIGLSFLALEFERAERLLERAIIWGDRAAERAENATPRQKAFTAAVGVLALAAFVTAAIAVGHPAGPGALSPAFETMNPFRGRPQRARLGLAPATKKGGEMDTYVILRRGGWRDGAELEEAAARSTEEGDKADSGVSWIRSYVLAEEDGRVGTVCIYQADSDEAIERHASAADLPVDEIVKVADTVIVRPDPQPAQA